MIVKNYLKADYEVIVNEILKLRMLSNISIQDMFYKNKHVLVNAAYEWDYYVSNLFQGAGVLDRIEGEVICKIQHGDSSKHRTLRKITRNYVKINKNVLNLCHKLLYSYPFNDVPLRLDDQEMLKIDVVKRIYSFYPSELLDDIGEKIGEMQRALLDLPKLIEAYAENDEEDSTTKFEKILEEGFNMFCNVRARHVGGAGETDIECLYLTYKKKFAVDAKSTKNKLTSLNAGRLKFHREKIGGAYTIVVTPRYVPAVLHDITI